MYSQMGDDLLKGCFVVVALALLAGIAIGGLVVWLLA